MRREMDVVTAVGGAVGVLLVVIGLVALARAGFAFDALTTATGSVGPFDRTPLMAIIEIVLGLSVIGASLSADRGGLIGVGVLMLIFGLVVVIEPGAFVQALGAGTTTGVLYVLVGIACLLAGFLLRRPGTYVRERTVVR
jgi:uncharacterized membrane protein HdeD (DUF308 family)